MNLVLDLSSPGSDHARLAAVARSVGAIAVAGYLRNWPQWTLAMIQGLEDTGITFFPIELYNGQGPGDTAVILSTLGLSPRAVALDVETGSWPSLTWQAAWCASVAEAGYAPVGYSQAQGPYRYRWQALYTWPGIPDQRSVLPIQKPGPGYDAVQYAHDIPLGSYTVDISDFLFEVDMSFTDNDRTTLDTVITYVAALYTADPSKIDGSTFQLLNIVRDIQAKVADLEMKIGDLGTVRTELETLKAEVEAGGSVNATSAIARIEAALRQA